MGEPVEPGQLVGGQAGAAAKHHMLEKMRKTGGCRHLTASVGAVPVLPGESPSESVTRADMAAYEAKLSGGDCVAVREA